MNLDENRKQLQFLILSRFSREIHYYSLPKTNNAQEMLEDEMAISLLQNKKLRSYFKGSDMVVPVYRGSQLDGAVTVVDADGLDRKACLQITELIELLITDIMTLHDESEALGQMGSQLYKQKSIANNFYTHPGNKEAVH